MKFYQMKEAEYMKTALTREKAIGLLREMGSGILCENPFKWIFILL